MFILIYLRAFIYIMTAYTQNIYSQISVSQLISKWGPSE